MKTIILAGGCFWCMESPYHEVQGILETVPGYTGGEMENPTYYDVTTGQTGHFEAVKLTYDENIIKLEEILEIFWKQIDPTDSSGQFADRGSQYRTAIFYSNKEEYETAVKSRKTLESRNIFPHKIETEILPMKTFYPAEDYHHKYFLKEPVRYRTYKRGSGREKFIEHYWGG